MCWATGDHRPNVVRQVGDVPRRCPNHFPRSSDVGRATWGIKRAEHPSSMILSLGCFFAHKTSWKPRAFKTPRLSGVDSSRLLQSPLKSMEMLEKLRQVFDVDVCPDRTDDGDILRPMGLVDVPRCYRLYTVSRMSVVDHGKGILFDSCASRVI